VIKALTRPVFFRYTESKKANKGRDNPEQRLFSGVFFIPF
jgi:hypothetical protein